MSVYVTYYPDPEHLPHARMDQGLFPELNLGPDGTPVIRSTGMTKPEFANYLRILMEQASWLADRLEGHHAEDEGPRYQVRT